MSPSPYPRVRTLEVFCHYCFSILLLASDHFLLLFAVVIVLRLFVVNAIETARFIFFTFILWQPFVNQFNILYEGITAVILEWMW